MNIWEKIARKKDPTAGLAEAIEALLRERPHLDRLDIFFAVQTAGTRQRTTAAELKAAMELLEGQNRIVKLGNGYVCCSLSTEEVLADL